MYSAYLCTTISTVVAMITSFLASQHAFCFQQILAEKESTTSASVVVAGNLKNNNNSLHRHHQGPLGNIVHHNFDHGDQDDDSLMPKVCTQHTGIYTPCHYLCTVKILKLTFGLIHQKA